MAIRRYTKNTVRVSKRLVPRLLEPSSVGADFEVQMGQYGSEGCLQLAGSGTCVYSSILVMFATQNGVTGSCLGIVKSCSLISRGHPDTFFATSSWLLDMTSTVSALPFMGLDSFISQGVSAITVDRST